MNDEVKRLEESIKREHRFGYRPKYKNEFRTKLSTSQTQALASKVIQEIGWDIVYRDEKSLEAKCLNKKYNNGEWTEAITIVFENGKIEVTSKTLGEEMWDNGKNSLRVKLFITLFQNLEENFDESAVNSFVQKLKANDEWEDYEIPKELPRPKFLKTPNLKLLLIMSLLASLVLAFLLAVASRKIFYFLGFYELMLGSALAYVIAYFIKFTNYTNAARMLKLILLAATVIVFFNQFFQYILYLFEANSSTISFPYYMKIILEQGLTFEDLNFGEFGFVVFWFLQLIFIAYTANSLITPQLINYKIDRIPPQVVDFAFYYLIIKKNSENEVKKRLAGMGWSEPQNQQEVFEALDAYALAKSHHRIK